VCSGISLFRWESGDAHCVGVDFVCESQFLSEKIVEVVSLFGVLRFLLQVLVALHFDNLVSLMEEKQFRAMLLNQLLAARPSYPLAFFRRGEFVPEVVLFPHFCFFFKGSFSGPCIAFWENQRSENCFWKYYFSEFGMDRSVIIIVIINSFVFWENYRCGCFPLFCSFRGKVLRRIGV